MGREEKRSKEKDTHEGAALFSGGDGHCCYCRTHGHTPEAC